ncbi:hypothetical protein SAMN02745121_01642 [Nannocystis exedens]|uniref:Uncharacterized protein n=1 Tax=Nannocystis exedens TaxID=54 RepID=A0A1I1VEW8_9BACT|nr:hypothetical protein NAEX_05545 [Nannocystis exedens]SFD79633.1 hypothetical protein SAMN02745121_01642 [Nannocystis exedens]
MFFKTCPIGQRRRSATGGLQRGEWAAQEAEDAPIWLTAALTSS